MARKLKDYPCIALKPEDLKGEIDFVRVFGRSRHGEACRSQASPLHVEIGTGKATFLLSQAMAQPNVNFLGIERANKYYRYAVDRIGRWGLTNIRVIRTDAAAFLADFLPTNSVDCFHIYFPDPWPKRRHHKRRFFCPTNLEHLVRCLKTGGTLRIATDHAAYFEQIRILITDRNEQLEQTEFLPSAGASNGELSGTNYERKYIKDKRQIYTIAAMKK